VDGVDAAQDARVRAGLGYLPQRISFPEGVTAREAMRFYARLRDVSRAEVERLLDWVGLTDAAERVTDGFSGGMRQRLGLAVALLGRPRVLLLDEPSAALDPSGALLVRDLLAAVAADGTTVLLSSHDLSEVSALAARVAIFDAGRVSALGTIAELEDLAGVRGLESVYRRLSGGIAPTCQVKAA
jgi:Cu-processing system ATP-binding protein